MSIKNISKELKSNWKAGITVSLVNIPLSLSLAIASGAAPTVGIVTAILAGLIAAIVGGSHFNVAGPAGALSGILIVYVMLYGAAIIPVLTILAGLIVLMVWFFGWDKYIVFIPSSVVHGFTLAVAVTIALGQVNFALGLSGLSKHESLIGNFFESLKHISSIYWPAFIVFFISLVILFALFKYAPKFPGAIAIAVGGIMLGASTSFQKLPFTLSTLYSSYGDLSISFFNTSFIKLSVLNPKVLEAAALVAVVIILETLLSAKVADGMTKTKFDQSREVLGIGCANVVSGIFGGMPATGVFARTALNIRSGATSRYSAVINAVATALISFVFLGWFKYLPLAVVAAILVNAASRMVAKEHFTKLWRFDKTAFGISIFVAVLSIVYDPMVGIIMGSVISLLVFVNYLSQAQGEVVVGEGDKELARISPEELKEYTNTGTMLIYRFVGELNYMNAERHKEYVHGINGDHYVVFNFKNLFYIDMDGLDALDEMVYELESRGKKVYLCGVSAYIQPLFSHREWFSNKIKNQEVFENVSSACDKIRAITA
ncbi:MAG: SulP family inorganic anion transporter [bacterium]